jgi:hypothetical protein
MTLTRKKTTKRHEQVFAKDLNVDPDVQRYRDEKQVAKLEREWDPLYAGTLVVSQRADGSLWVIDGQHRAAAGQRVDPEVMLDAEIYTGLTKQAEARMFLSLNRDRKAPRPYDNFRVALAAGMEIELRMDRQVKACGLEMAASPSANKVAAVEACRRIVLKDKAETGLLTDTLTTVEGAWGRTSETWDNMVLQAVSSVIFKNRSNVDLRRMSRTLAKHQVYQWKTAGMGGSLSGGGSVSRSTKLAEYIVTKYNTNLKTPSKMLVA